MSPAFPSESPNSRTWWSLAPKQPHHLPSKDSRRPHVSESLKSPSRTSKSNSFTFIASAIGLKSKKRPTLTIQDPPSSRTRTSTPPIVDSEHVTNTYPSKSSSSTRTRLNSLEPRTPTDSQRGGHQSLLTLSDIDPFAVRTISSAPHTPSDPARLSIYSNSSIRELLSRGLESPPVDRISYASSSHSNITGSDISPLSSNAESENFAAKKLKPKRSIGSLHRKQSLVSSDGSLGSAWESLTLANRTAMSMSMSKPGSSATLTDKNRFSQPDPTSAPRPLMRARGMTDSGANQRPGFFQDDVLPSKRPPAQQTTVASHTSPTTSPRVIIRQPSSSRVGLPPSAPPKHELPPPPHPDHIRKNVDSEGIIPISTGSSSSSLSFASSVSSNREMPNNQTYSPRKKKKSPEGSFAGKAEVEGSSNTPSKISPHSSTTSHALKKALSHQSLGRLGQPFSNSMTSPPPEGVSEKILRKQRSFHHPKLPVPSIPFPMRHPSSYGPDNSPIIEQRRGSASAVLTPGRMRIFSGSNSRRPSTSQGIVPDDDNRSVFSVPSAPDQGFSPFKSSAQPTSPSSTSPLSDEGFHDPAPPSSPHLDQQIMSPAEMAELEASVENSGTYARERGLSILSTSTIVTSDGEHEVISDDLGPTSVTQNNLGWGTMPTRSNSLFSRALTVPIRPSLRPLTSPANMTPPSTTNSGVSGSPSNLQTITSLPPPPRRSRPKPTIFTSQSPDGITALSPPPIRKHVRAKLSLEKALHHRSIIKKPSFLEIDDDTDDMETDTESIGDPLDGSFLDLARESFDTVRSTNE